MILVNNILQMSNCIKDEKYFITKRAKWDPVDNLITLFTTSLSPNNSTHTGFWGLRI
jgi:hypothetical protein